MSTIKSSSANLTLNADGSGNDVIIQSNASTKAIVTAEGNVGVGLTPTDFTNRNSLDIGLAGKIWGHTSATETGMGSNFYYDGAYKRTATAAATRHIQDTNGHTFDVAASGSADAAITWTTPLSIANDGDVTVGTGNLVIGTSGKGIDFSAQTASATGTTTSELLDHYEEGTFTPTLGGTSSDPTVSYYQQRGYYIKIGQLVHFEVFVQTSSTSGGSGSLTIEGLPFTVSNAGSWDQSIATVTYHYFNRNGTDPQVTGEIKNNDTKVQFVQSYDNGAAAGMDTTALTADGSWVKASGNYRAA